MLIGALLIFVAAGLTGRDLRRLASVELVSAWLLPTALLLQILALAIFSGADGVPVQLMHIASYGVIGAFVYVNRALPGLWVMAAGAASNGITITLNGGTLPSSTSAQMRAGITPSDTFANSAVLEDPKLVFLGDVFAVPSYIPYSNTYSIGDVLLLVGMALMVATICRKTPVDTDVAGQSTAGLLPRQSGGGRRRKTTVDVGAADS